MYLSHLHKVFLFILFIYVFIVSSVEVSFILLKLFFKATVNKLYYYYYCFISGIRLCESCPGFDPDLRLHDVYSN